MLSRYPNQAPAEEPRRETHSPSLMVHRDERIQSVTARSSLIFMLPLLGLVALLVGCAPVQPLVVDEPIGPLKWRADESRGSLIVYSYAETSSVDPAETKPRSDYTIYTASGESLLTVSNRDALFSRDPAIVELPVGRYKVAARAADFRLVTVTVVIHGGHTTVVDLTQDLLGRATAANGDWVRLPNGQVIGSRSQ